METIKSIIATLNRVEVHGKQNLDMLLGCIMALERLMQSGGEEEDDGRQEN